MQSSFRKQAGWQLAAGSWQLLPFATSSSATCHLSCFPLSTVSGLAHRTARTAHTDEVGSSVHQGCQGTGVVVSRRGATARGAAAASVVTYMSHTRLDTAKRLSAQRLAQWMRMRACEKLNTQRTNTRKLPCNAAVSEVMAEEKRNTDTRTHAHMLSLCSVVWRNAHTPAMSAMSRRNSAGSAQAANAVTPWP